MSRELCHETGVNGKTDCWLSCSAAVSALGCPLLCSDEGDGSVISVSRAGELKFLGNHRT